MNALKQEILDEILLGIEALRHINNNYAQNLPVDQLDIQQVNFSMVRAGQYILGLELFGDRPHIGEEKYKQAFK